MKRLMAIGVVMLAAGAVSTVRAEVTQTCDDVRAFVRSEASKNLPWEVTAKATAPTEEAMLRAYGVKGCVGSLEDANERCVAMGGRAAVQYQFITRTLPDGHIEGSAVYRCVAPDSTCGPRPVVLTSRNSTAKPAYFRFYINGQNRGGSTVSPGTSVRRKRSVASVCADAYLGVTAYWRQGGRVINCPLTAIVINAERKQTDYNRYTLVKDGAGRTVCTPQ